MKTKLIIVSIAAAFLLGACDGSPKVRAQTDNSEFEVGELFTHEGCTVYRFRDGGRSHYYTNCKGSVSSTYTVQSGKARVTRQDEIPTTVHE